MTHSLVQAYVLVIDQKCHKLKTYLLHVQYGGLNKLDNVTCFYYRSLFNRDILYSNANVEKVEQNSLMLLHMLL